MREIILDTETTGLDPNSGHRIVEIGCVEMIHKMRTGKTFHSYINPLRDVPQEAQAVHGISSEFLLDKPVFVDIANALVEFLGDATLVIHNASFDMKFLNYELKMHGYEIWPNERVLDTLAMARKKFPGAPASLDALCKRFGVDLSVRTKHGALLDAELLSEVYIELCGGKQVGIDFAQAAIVAEHEKELSLTTNRTIPTRTYTVSDEERALHEAMIGKIKDALWKEYA
jgi:DNA polymerase-3 subunit epsilon